MPVPTKPLILVVEDEAIIRMLAVDVLAEAGFSVMEAAHADEGLILLERNYDLIRLLFTDVQMPGTLNGAQLAHHTLHCWPWISLLITSAFPPPLVGKLPNASRFLAKPYEPSHLIRHARELVRIDD